MLNCVNCEQVASYRMKVGPDNLRCGADKFKRWVGCKGFLVKPRPWCVKRNAEYAQGSEHGDT